ncbi:MAG: AmmeMemoRadiSam system protein B [Candidatus Aenigmarchaeota archaeon]|nr:AmmeMemoRadiSam system protein B [Candidatus Aenigmarchaeota archaeon]
MEKRHPVVSGVFYESDPRKLRNSLESMFRNTKTHGNLGVISPHAGYVYSGKTSAFSIASLKPSESFLLIGPNHNLLGHEFSVSRGIWETPLGEAKIDDNLADDLMKNELINDDYISHSHEHSLEVQIPFLQHKFRNFRFVPLSVANMDYSFRFLSKCESVAKTISSALRKKDFRIIVSSDFSHYLPQDEADEKDEKAIGMIRNLDVRGFFTELERMDASVCGYGPVVILMAVAKEMGWKKIDVMNHSSSGDVTKDRYSVVNYYSIGFR